MKTAMEYRESLKDGRETYFEGARVEDLEGVPALAAPISQIADGYDKHYSSAPEAINPLVEPPRGPEQMRELMPVLSEVDEGLLLTHLGIMTLLTAAARMHAAEPECHDRIMAYVEQAVADDIRVTECITDAKGDRSLPPSRQPDPDAYVRVVERTSDGVIIRGAKLHITGASLVHDLIVMPTKTMKSGEEEYAISCAVPVNAPGVRIANVTSYPRTADTRHFPISERHSMPDGFVIFDDVFVPYERVFLDGQCQFSALFAHSLGLWIRLGSMAIMVRQADAIVGLASLIAEANGLGRVSHIRQKIDEMAIHATMLRAGLEAGLTHAHTTPEGYCFPDEMYINAAKYTGAANFNLMVRHLHDIAGGSVVTMPSIADLENDTIGPALRKYISTGPDITAEYRARLFHAIRDLTADTYGGYQAVENIQGGGSLHAQRLVMRKHYDLDHARTLATQLAQLNPTYATSA